MPDPTYPVDIPTYLEAFTTSMACGDFPRAESILHEALGAHPDSVELWLTVGDYHAPRGQHDLAIECLEQAAALAPSDVRPRIGLGTLFAMTGQHDAARGHLERARHELLTGRGRAGLPPHIAPRNLERVVALNLAQLEQESGNPWRALELTRPWLDDPVGWHQAASIRIAAAVRLSLDPIEVAERDILGGGPFSPLQVALALESRLDHEEPGGPSPADLVTRLEARFDEERIAELPQLAALVARVKGL